MADELELHYMDQRPPEAVMAAWRASPPPALDRFDIVDEAYNSLTWEARFLDWPARIMVICSLGLILLWRKLFPMESVWRVTTRFDGADGRTRVTITGKASEQTRTALGEVVAEHGGSIGLRVGA